MFLENSTLYSDKYLILPEIRRLVLVINITLRIKSTENLQINELIKNGEIRVTGK